MAAPVGAAPREHNFTVEKIPKQQVVCVRCTSCDVIFAQFPIQENTRLTVTVMMNVIEKAISSVRKHVDILGSCKQVHEPMRPATMEDVL